MTRLSTPFKPVLGFSSHNLSLLTKQIELQRLTLLKVQSALSPDLARHVKHCITASGKVIVYTDSAGWATQLRFYSETILTALSQTEAKLVVKVMMPFHTKSGTAKTTPSTPSQAVINDISTVSKHIQDKGLSEALARLSNTLNRAKIAK